MKTGVVALLGLFYTAFGMESVVGRGELVRSHFEVIKTVNETMVYYIKRIQEIGSDNVCTAVSEEIARFGLSKRYPTVEIHPKGNGYDIVQTGRTNISFQVCEGVVRPVILEHDIITLTPKLCQFSEMFCDIKSETAFWTTSTNLEIIARGQANIWILNRHPLVKLLVFEEIDGIFMLQLLRKIKNEKNEEVWVTNINGLQARETPDNSSETNFSHLGQYLTHSDVLKIKGVNSKEADTRSNKYSETDDENRGEGEVESGGVSKRSGCTASGSEDRVSQILSPEQMVFYTFILVVILAAFYFLERIFGLIINCVILSRTRNRGCIVLCLKSLSQSMMNNHLYRYYTDEVSVSKTSDVVFGMNRDYENTRQSNDIVSLNVFNKDHSGYI